MKTERKGRKGNAKGAKVFKKKFLGALCEILATFAFGSSAVRQFGFF
jgi:hypothetical protein